MTGRTLFPLPAATALSDRQQLAHDLLTANPAGVRATDLGAYLHQTMGSRCACAPNVRCKYARAEGDRIGRQLRKLDLAILRKTGLWQLIKPPATGYDPSTSDIPY